MNVKGKYIHPSEGENKLQLGQKDVKLKVFLKEIFANSNDSEHVQT